MLHLRHPASRVTFVVLAVVVGLFASFPIAWMLLTAFNPPACSRWRRS